MASLRCRAALLAALLATTIPTTALLPLRASAQQEEARLLFERGNEHLARGLRARGRTRERELNEALDAYLGVLRLGARTRNVVFNVGLTMAELGRHDEAFNYFSEYLRAFDLSADERAEGEQRVEALRARVAVVRIESTPPGAEVRVDRRDLPARGQTPLELALPAGSHPVFLARPGYAEGTATVIAGVGELAGLRVELTAEPVDVQVIAPGGGRLTLDDRPIEPGRHVPVAPGPHVVRLELPSAPPIERRFEVAAGDAPLALELSSPGHTAAAGARIAMSIDAPAEVYVDNVRAAQGEQIDLPMLPGPHMLRVVASGRRPLVHRVELDTDQRLQLRVHLGADADATGLDVARTTFGVLTGVGLGVSIGLGVRALSLSDQWNSDLMLHNQQVAQGAIPTITEKDLRIAGREVEDAALMADIGWAITAALAITTIVLLVVGPGSGDESSVRVGAAPTSTGGLVTASIGWGR